MRLLLLLLLLLLLSSLSPFAAAQGGEEGGGETTTPLPWRPTPLRASPPTASLSANATAIIIQLRYKTWDGNFLDVVELAAGPSSSFFFRRSAVK